LNEHIEAESIQPRLSRESKVIEAEEVLDGPQERVGLYGVVTTVPARTNFDKTTAPTRQPPGPAIPGKAELGPGISLQQAVVSALDALNSAASNKISSNPSR